MSISYAFRLSCALVVVALVLSLIIFGTSNFLTQVSTYESFSQNPTGDIKITTRLGEDQLRRRKYEARIANGSVKLPDRRALEEVQAAILKDATSLNFGGDFDTFYVRAGETNPLHLLRYITNDTPIVRPGSEFELGKGVLLTMNRIDWIDETTVEVRVDLVYGSVGASHSKYRIIKVNGMWVITEKKLLWLS